jgi:putative transposase
LDPFDLTQIDVTYQGRAMGRAVPVHIGRHVHPAVRQSVTPPPKASGIDYLALVSQRLAAQERARLGIAYVKLSDPQSAHTEKENS